MNREKLRADYDYFSGKASDIARQLAFAGIAIIWVFKTDQAGRYVVPSELFLPGTLIVLGLALDFLHYIVATAIWGIYNRIKEKQHVGEDEDFKAPPIFNWPALIFFWAKVAAIAAAYFFLLRFLWQSM